MKRVSFILSVLLVFALFSLASCGGGTGDVGGDTPSSAKAITAFSFADPAATGTINETAKTIKVNVPSGTSVTALGATFTTTGQSVKVNGTAQASGITQNNFTNPVIYAVVAADLSTQNYTVTVTVGPLNAQWAKTVKVGINSSSSLSSLNSVATGTDGSVYAAGTINGYATFDFGNLVTASVGTYAGDNALLVKYDNSGTVQWAKAVTVPNNTNTSSFVSLSTSTIDGSLYAAGSLKGSGTFDFGNGVTTSPTYSTGPTMLLLKYDSSGNAQWARTVTGGNEDSWFSGAAVASDGSVYVAGSIYGNITFDFGNGVTATGSNSFNNSIILVKYSSAGVAQWARTTTAGLSSSFSDVSIASDGSVYAAGTVYGTETYDFGYSVTAAASGNSANVVLVKYDSSGIAQWAKTTATGTEQTSFSSVAVTSDGSIYAGGRVFGNGTLDFGNSVTTAAPYDLENNFLLVKYSSAGVPQWARTPASASSSSYFYDVAVGTDGSVYTAGYIYGSSTFSFGNGITRTGAYSGGNLVIAKYNSSGAAQAARSVSSGSDPSLYNGVTAGSDGSVYAAGYIRGISTFNFGNSVTAKGESLGDNLVLVKYH